MKMILISQKRTCKGCIAAKNTDLDCNLGYNITGLNGYMITTGVPQEPCPKPKTNADYWWCYKWFKKGKNNDS